MSYIHKLIPVDQKLFDSMVNKYQSLNEKTFFEEMKHKQEHEFTVSNDLILWEGDNEDRLYIVRCEYEEYILGCESKPIERHYMTLHDALFANLKNEGLLQADITLFDWLRQRDYKGIQYNHNYDNL